MINNIYIVWDELSKSAGAIFEARNDACAQRYFKQMFKGVPVDVSKTFKVVKLGTFDNESCKLETSELEEIFAGVINNELEDDTIPLF